MDKLIVPVLVGLLAGGGGVFLGKSLVKTEAGPAASADTTALEERIASLEAALAQQGNAPALLEGDAKPGGAAAAPGGRMLVSDKLTDAQLATLSEQLAPHMQETLKAAIDERIAEGGSIEALIAQEANKKKITLGELATELDLTRDQEVEMRELALSSTEEFLKALAGEDETVDDVRRDFEDAKGDPTKQAELAGKYMGRMMSNLGPIMTAAMKYESGMTKILGAEKKAKMESGYTVTDLDPLGLEAVFEGTFGD